MSGMETVLREHIRAKTFEELKIPLIVCATNYNLGKPEYFSKGELIHRIIASASIPVMFTPAVLDKHLYIDGGITDNLPVTPIIGKCRNLFGFHVNPIGEEKSDSSIMRIAERSFHLAMSINMNNKIPLFDLYIEPDELKQIGLLDVSRAKEIYDIGYRYTKNLLQVKKMVLAP
jgi:NTE family protein